LTDILHHSGPGIVTDMALAVAVVIRVAVK
jgi:hypothetical protein